jgi:hypothetical protein
MSSFIHAQRRNVDRLLALILLWNVIGGAFVTLGAPWLAQLADTTGLRPAGVLPTGSGWLAIGVPTHFAGIWLPLLGVYALHRRRHQLHWHLAAVAFYAPQTFATTSPLHIDMWVGLFDATSFQCTAGAVIAVNWIAIALLLIHAARGLWSSRFRVYLERMPAGMLRLSRQFWGATPLSRAALSRRYASIATISASAFVPLVPAEFFFPSGRTLEFVETQHFGAWFEKDGIFWRMLLLLPVTFVAGYVMAFVWSGGRREPRFSAVRGMVATLLTYAHMAMAADLLSRWLTDGRQLVYALLLVAWIFMLPLMLVLPAIGALTGAWLGRNLGGSQASDQGQSSRLTWGMWLTLVMPLLALPLSYAVDSYRHWLDSTGRRRLCEVEHAYPAVHNGCKSDVASLPDAFTYQHPAVRVARSSLQPDRPET